MKRRVLLGVLGLVLLGGLLGFEWARDQVAVGNGYVAKELCSCVFVGARRAESCRSDVPPAMDGVRFELGSDRVRAFVPYLGERIARFEPPFGCVLY